MSALIGWGPQSNLICNKKFNAVKGENLGIPVHALPDIKIIASITKTVICAIGFLFQAAKTLLKLPFAVVIAPFAYILEKVAAYLIEQAKAMKTETNSSLTQASPMEIASVEENLKFAEQMQAFAEGISLNFSKDLIMTVHLIQFTFSEKINESSNCEYTVMEVFDAVCGVVGGTDELYKESARDLWADYIYGDKQLDDTLAANKFEEDLAKSKRFD